MRMLWHHDIAGDHKQRTPADSLLRVFKEIHGRGQLEIRPAAVATEGEKVKFSSLLRTNARAFHAPRRHSNSDSVGGDQ
jgi:hypothetical protein